MRTQTKQTLGLITVLLAAVAVYIGYDISKSYANTAVPGSVDDPIVTKSYVDERVAELVRQELANIGGGGGGAALEVVTLPVGKRLMVSGGGEVIVRTGKAVAYSQDANGLSDLTEGKDIAPGQPVPTNHLILFPKDGRGIEVDPNQKNGLIVLIRGSYQIQ